MKSKPNMNYAYMHTFTCEIKQKTFKQKNSKLLLKYHSYWWKLIESKYKDDFLKTVGYKLSRHE